MDIVRRGKNSVVKKCKIHLQVSQIDHKRLQALVKPLLDFAGDARQRITLEFELIEMTEIGDVCRQCCELIVGEIKLLETSKGL